jgi:hypothetical protein
MLFSSSPCRTQPFASLIAAGTTFEPSEICNQQLFFCGKESLFESHTIAQRLTCGCLPIIHKQHLMHRVRIFDAELKSALILPGEVVSSEEQAWGLESTNYITIDWD